MEQAQSYIIKAYRAGDKLADGNAPINKLTAQIQNYLYVKNEEWQGIAEPLDTKVNLHTNIAYNEKLISYVDKECTLRNIVLDKKANFANLPPMDSRIQCGGQMIANAQNNVYGGSKEYDQAERSYQAIADRYKKFRELDSNETFKKLNEAEQDEYRLRYLEKYQKAAQKALKDINKYIDRRKSKGPIEDNRNLKTQYRINVMLSAIDTIHDTNAYMDDRRMELERKAYQSERKEKAAHIEKQTVYMQKCLDEYTAKAQDTNESPMTKKSAQFAADAVQQIRKMVTSPNELTQQDKETACRGLIAVGLHTHNLLHSFQNPTDEKYAAEIDKLAADPYFVRATEDISKESLTEFFINPAESSKKILTSYFNIKLTEVEKSTNTVHQPKQSEPNKQGTERDKQGIEHDEKMLPLK